MRERYFDDFTVGDKIDTAGFTVTESHIIDFALRYDPQPFHLDVNAAKESIYGGLIGSGFMTLAISFRLLMQSGALGASNLGGAGLDEVRFLRPVRPGDTLRVQAEVTDMRPSKSKPDRGVLTLRYRAYNQRGEDVLSMICPHMVRRQLGV